MENQDNKTLQNLFIEHANNSMETISASDTPRVKQLRQEALKRFIDNGFPTKKMEKWRNSRMIECVNEDFNIDKIESKKPAIIFENEKYQKDEDIFQDLEQKMIMADIIFAEVTIPSLGVGYELGYADKLGKKIIAIYDETYTKKVSTMIRGNKRIKLIPYTDINDICKNMNKLLNGN